VRTRDFVFSLKAAALVGFLLVCLVLYLCASAFLRQTSPPHHPSNAASRPIADHPELVHTPPVAEITPEKPVKMAMNSGGGAASIARVYPDVNANMPRAYWDYDSVNISWGVLENYEVVRKIGMYPFHSDLPSCC
jgi:casein kinase II subunit alpha